jgi:hypothetical protein
MNNRIGNLILTAQQQAAKETIPNSFAYENLVYTKFAELLIRECCKEITQEPFNAGMASLWLKEHFGVEE